METLLSQLLRKIDILDILWVKTKGKLSVTMSQWHYQFSQFEVFIFIVITKFNKSYLPHFVWCYYTVTSLLLWLFCFLWSSLLSRLDSPFLGVIFMWMPSEGRRINSAMSMVSLRLWVDSREKRRSTLATKTLSSIRANRWPERNLDYHYHYLASLMPQSGKASWITVTLGTLLPVLCSGRGR